MSWKVSWKEKNYKNVTVRFNDGYSVTLDDVRCVYDSGEGVAFESKSERYWFNLNHMMYVVLTYDASNQSIIKEKNDDNS